MKDLIAEHSVPEPNSGCWLWTAKVGRGGYGMLQVNRRWYMATHVSLEAVGRQVPKGMQACHRCDVPACVNPDHLFIGTQLDNIRDCMAKGRFVAPPIAMKGIRTNALLCRNGHPRTPGQGLCCICRRANELRKLARQKEQRAAARSLHPSPIYPCGPDHKAGINLYISPLGKRECRACNRMAAQRYAASLRGRIAA